MTLSETTLAALPGVRIAGVSEPARRSFIDVANGACFASRLLNAIEHALVPIAAACHAAIELPGLGRFEIGLRERRGVLVVRFRCHASQGHAWLSRHRLTLETRLAARTGARVRLSMPAPR